jgi:predicted  nucleic acid-binding Zn-ribbon protein
MFETFKIGFGETQWVVMTALGLYTWFINKQSASAKEMLDIRLRVTELESAVKDMPSKLEIARLEGQIETIKTQLNSANNNIGQVQRGVTRIENWLIDNKK